jgi:hypothetical protein
MQVVLWVCYKCGNYYGATSAENLHLQFNRDLKGGVTFSRIRCPHCKIDRVRVKLEVDREELFEGASA